MNPLSRAKMAIFFIENTNICVRGTKSKRVIERFRFLLQEEETNGLPIAQNPNESNEHYNNRQLRVHVRRAYIRHVNEAIDTLFHDEGWGNPPTFHILRGAGLVADWPDDSFFTK
jgi:hypothetical protein